MSIYNFSRSLYNLARFQSNRTVFQAGSDLDSVSGTNSNDILVSGDGTHALGGNGNDTYIVNSITNTITESLNGGTDTVLSAAPYALGNNLENMILTGNNNINGYGNSHNNWINGNSANNYLSGGDGNDRLAGKAGNDQLYGGEGKDTLIGGSGNDILIGNSGNDVLTGGEGFDQFLFHSPTEGIDRITDFNSSEGDKILVSCQGFSLDLVIGSLPENQFTIGSSATTESDRLIYDSSTGALFFDEDGSGALGQVQFATLASGLSLSSTDFSVFV
jgi:Ca2+-binding RTX toxin-like protein